MTTVVTLIALNLFGVFEVYLGGRTMGAAASASSKEGAAGAFFNGLLATALATSCTAPLLGAAVGFALAPGQQPMITLLMFLMLGVGLAFPYVLLSWKPGWLKFLPKPGLWMERFKVAMGFPMLAAAVWLFSFVSLHYGDRSWWLAVFLVMVAVAAWIYGEFIQRHRTRPALAAVAIVAVLGTGYLWALESNLAWRHPVAQGQSAAVQPNDANLVPWQPWSSNAVAKARSEGRPILVDFTAKWCLTCNTIIKPALESTSVQQKLRDLNAVALLGDYTAFPASISDELNRYGRAGVPLVLVYPKSAQEPPVVLPEVLTPGMVVSALEKAGR
jgi:thiol:disulfide interchange protein